MSAPETLDQAQRDGWSDDSLLRCDACGRYGAPEDVEFVSDERGLLCVDCAESGEREARLNPRWWKTYVRGIRAASGVDRLDNQVAGAAPETLARSTHRS